MAKHWRIHPHDPDRIASLQRAAGVPAVVAQLLLCRGLADPDDARQFLAPKLSALRDPCQLPGATCAAECIHRAVAAGHRIVIYGDYDVDGMTGIAVLWKCLNLLGADVGYYVPSRLDEGYGLNHEAIRTLAKAGTRMIVTVDCGIASVSEAVTARELGVELIVTDHHRPGEQLPEAAAIVHPDLPGGGYPFAGLSGSGVALKLAWALGQQAAGAQRVAPRMRDFLMQAVGLAGMGTVADVVPLVDENRVLVRAALESLTKRPSIGLNRLMHVAGLADKLRMAQRDSRVGLEAEDIGFSIAPRLNAAGRLGQARLAVELLITDREDRAEELAQYLDELNQQRKTLERSVYRAAHKQAKEKFQPGSDAALVLADRQWHVGVIGIVAARLAEKYHCPVVLISLDKMGVKPGVGSARSIPGFNLYAGLESAADCLIGFGGHAAAAGLQINETALGGFREAFCQYAAEEISAGQLEAELSIDAETPLSACTLQTIEQIEQMAPFGHANPRPLLCTTGVRLAAAPKKIGADGRHLSLLLNQHGVKLRAVAFGGGDWADELAALDGPIDVAYRPVINTFAGRRNVELHLVDWRATGEEGSSG